MIIKCQSCGKEILDAQKFFSIPLNGARFTHTSSAKPLPFCTVEDVQCPCGWITPVMFRCNNETGTPIKYDGFFL